MVTCKNCAETSPDGTVICPKCGTRLAPYTNEETEAYIASLRLEPNHTVTVGTHLGSPTKGRLPLKAIVVGISGIVLLLGLPVLLERPASAPPSAAPSMSPPASAAPETRKGTAECSPESQSKRLEFMQECYDLGIFQKTERSGSFPHLWVAPMFYDLDYDDKKWFVGVVYAYFVCDDASVDLIQLYDSKTGRKIGVYGAVYAGLRLD